MLEPLQQFVRQTDPIWQWMAVILVSAIPSVESYLGAAIGVVAGVPVPVAITAAIIGNWVSMFYCVMFGNKIQDSRIVKQFSTTQKKQKFKEIFDKYGIAGVSIIGQTLLPSQFTAMAMVSLGAHKNAVIFWQTISIVLWAFVFGTGASYGLTLL